MLQTPLVFRHKHLIALKLGLYGSESLLGTWRHSNGESLATDIPKNHEEHKPAADWISLIQPRQRFTLSVTLTVFFLFLSHLFSLTLG